MTDIKHLYSVGEKSINGTGSYCGVEMNRENATPFLGNATCVDCLRVYARSSNRSVLPLVMSRADWEKMRIEDLEIAIRAAGNTIPSVWIDEVNELWHNRAVEVPSPVDIFRMSRAEIAENYRRINRRRLLEGIESLNANEERMRELTDEILSAMRVYVGIESDVCHYWINGARETLCTIVHKETPPYEGRWGTESKLRSCKKCRSLAIGLDISTDRG